MPDWEAFFIPSMSLVEVFLRGTVMYVALLAVLRIFVRRHIGSLSIMDLLLMVLIADAAQNAMGADYKSITEGLVLCGTLIGWNFFFDWLAYRSPAVRKWLEPAPLPVIADGVLLRRNMRKELLTQDELVSQLREQGVEDYRTVRRAYIEPDGRISVLGEEESPAGQRNDQPPQALR